MHLIFIPARSNSKGIPHKNVQRVGSFSLIERALRSVQMSSIDARIVLAVDEGCCRDHAEELLGSNNYHGLEVYNRSASNARDHSTTESVMAEYLSPRLPRFRFETISLVQVTSPFTSPSTLERCIGATGNSGRASLTVARRHVFRWSQDGVPLNYDPTGRPRRQDWPGELFETGAVYSTTPALYKESGVRLSAPCNLIEVDDIEALEIDTGTDLAVCRAIAANEKVQ